MISLPIISDIEAWYKSPLGEKYLLFEQQQLDLMLNRVFGYYGVVLGNLMPWNLDACPISHKLQIASNLTNNPRADMVSDLQNLSLANESVDLMVLPHVLEFSEYPDAVLLEAERCLIPEGSIFILGFHAKSLFGLWRWLQGDSGNFPWLGHFLSHVTLVNQLEAFGFTVDSVNHFYFRPPFNHTEALKKLRFLEILGPLLWPYFGSGYAILARKQVACVTPVKKFSRVKNLFKSYVPSYSRLKK